MSVIDKFFSCFYDPSSGEAVRLSKARAEASSVLQEFCAGGTTHLDANGDGYVEIGEAFEKCFAGIVKNRNIFVSLPENPSVYVHKNTSYERGLDELVLLFGDTTPYLREKLFDYGLERMLKLDLPGMEFGKLFFLLGANSYSGFPPEVDFDSLMEIVETSSSGEIGFIHNQDDLMARYGFVHMDVVRALGKGDLNIFRLADQLRHLIFDRESYAEVLRTLYGIGRANERMSLVYRLGKDSCLGTASSIEELKEFVGIINRAIESMDELPICNGEGYTPMDVRGARFVSIVNLAMVFTAAGIASGDDAIALAKTHYVAGFFAHPDERFAPVVTGGMLPVIFKTAGGGIDLQEIIARGMSLLASDSGLEEGLGLVEVFSNFIETPDDYFEVLSICGRSGIDNRDVELVDKLAHVVTRKSDLPQFLATAGMIFNMNSGIDRNAFVRFLDLVGDRVQTIDEMRAAGHVLFMADRDDMDGFLARIEREYSDVALAAIEAALEKR